MHSAVPLAVLSITVKLKGAVIGQELHSLRVVPAAVEAADPEAAENLLALEKEVLHLVAASLQNQKSIL